MRLAAIFLEEAGKQKNSPLAKMVFQAQKNFRDGKKEGSVDKYWKIINKADDSAEILIYEQIGKSYWDDSGVGAKQFAEDLKGLSVKGIKNLDVGINSPGGSVFEGLAIYNMLVNFPGIVNTRIDGIAASISSVVFMAGRQRVMPANAMLMIHDPSGVAMGTSTDMKKMAEILDKIKVSLISAYKEGTGLSDEEVAGLMANETWFTAQEARDKGFCNDMAAAVNIAATFDLTQFRNAPIIKLSAIEGINNVADKPKKEAKMDIQELKENHPELVKAVADEAKAPLVQENTKLVEANTGLTARVAELDVANKEFAKALAIEKSAATASKAEGIQSGILADSKIPEAFHGKVKGMVCHSKHLTEDGSLKAEAFTEAFKAEVSDWESKLSGSDHRTGMEDGARTDGLGASSDEELGRELARKMGKIRSDKE